MRLLLIRHGQTPSNVIGAIDTAHPGSGLTSLGLVQAAAVPGALAGQPITGIYASTLTRTQLTADPLSTDRGLDIRVRPGLEEISAGDLEMSPNPADGLRFHHCFTSWIQGDLDQRVPGGQNGHEFLERYQAALELIASDHRPGDTVALFSHGAAIRVYAAQRALGVDQHTALEIGIENTGAVILDGDPRGGWQLTAWIVRPLGGSVLHDTTAHDVTGGPGAANLPLTTSRSASSD